MRVRVISTVVMVIASLFLNTATFARMFSQVLCKMEGYHCKHVKRGQSWTSLWPDPHDRDILMRINRMNTQLYAGLTIAVPNQLDNADIMDFSPFPKHIQPPQEKLVVVDTQTLAWGAYDTDGSLVRWGPISSGSDYCRDIDEPCYTHAGSYRVFTLGSSDRISRKFPLPDGGAPMPYCMYFNEGQALHGEPNGLPGFNASHGCVRLYVNDAEWLRYSFIEGPNVSNEYRGTKVVVGPENPNDNSDSTDSQDESSDNYDDGSQ